MISAQNAVVVSNDDPLTSTRGIRLNFIRPGNNVTDQYLQVTNQAVSPQSAVTDAKHES